MEHMSYIEEYMNDHFPNLFALEEDLSAQIEALEKELFLRNEKITQTKTQLQQLEAQAKAQCLQDLKHATQLEVEIKELKARHIEENEQKHLAWIDRLLEDEKSYYASFQLYQYTLLQSKLEQSFTQFYERLYAKADLDSVDIEWCLRTWKRLHTLSSKLGFESHIKRWMCEQLNTVAKQLYEKYQRVFQNLMATNDIQWPSALPCSIFDKTAATMTLANFGKALQILCIISVELDHISVEDTLALLIEPIAIRFKFHLTGEKIGSQIGKVDWCFAYFYDLLNHHKLFIKEDLIHVAKDARLASLEPSLQERYLEKLISEFTHVLVLNMQVSAGSGAVGDYLEQALSLDRYLKEEFCYSMERASFVFIIQRAPDMLEEYIRSEVETTFDFLEKVVFADDHWRIHSDQLVELLKNQIQVRLPFLSFELFVSMMNELYDVYVDMIDPGIAGRVVESVLQELLKAFLLNLEEKIANVKDEDDEVLFYAHSLFSLDVLVSAVQDWNSWPQLDEKPFEKSLERISTMKAELVLRVFHAFVPELHMLLDMYGAAELHFCDTAQVCTESMVAVCNYASRLLRYLSLRSALPSVYLQVVKKKYAQLIEKRLMDDIVLVRSFTGRSLDQFQVDLDYLHLSWEESSRGEKMVLSKLHEALTLIRRFQAQTLTELSNALSVLEEDLPFKSIPLMSSLGVTLLKVSECRKILSLQLLSKR